MDICTIGVLQPMPIVLQNESTHRQVWGDPSRIIQIVWNLIRNAIKFSPENGKILMHCRNPDNETFELNVIDEGIGIDKKLLKHIFDAFEQGGRAMTQRFGGLGLGLAISSAIAKAHNGNLQAFSEGRNRGATFRLTLPLFREDLRKQSSREMEFHQMNSEDKRLKELHVLLVEDHEDTAKAMALLLTRRGYHVKTLTRVREVADYVKEHAVDLLISDLNLVDGSGFDVLEQARLYHAQVPAIAISGLGMVEDVQRSLNAGFNAHETKPLSISRLVNTIQSLLVNKG